MISDNEFMVIRVSELSNTTDVTSINAMILSVVYVTKAHRFVLVSL